MRSRQNFYGNVWVISLEKRKIMRHEQRIKSAIDNRCRYGRLSKPLIGTLADNTRPQSPRYPCVILLANLNSREAL